MDVLGTYRDNLYIIYKIGIESCSPLLLGFNSHFYN